MEFCLLLAALVVVAWSAAGLKYLLRGRINPIPAGAVIFIVVASVFGGDYFSIDAAIPITIDRLYLVALIGIFGVLVVAGEDQLRPLNRTDALVFGLCGWMMVSTFTHDWMAQEKLPVSRLLFFNLMPVLLYVIVRNARIGPKELRTITTVLALFGLYLVVTGIAEAAGQTSFVFPKYIGDASIQEFFGRARGPFINPITNGIFLIVGLASMLAFWNHVNNPIRFLIVLAVPLFVFVIYSTLTRSVWVSFAFSVALVVMLVVPSRWRGGVMMMGVICGFLMLAVVGGRLTQFKRDKFVSEVEMRQSAELRPLFAIVAVRMFRDHPVAGHGFGQYSMAKDPYLQDPSGKYPLAITRPYMQHNLFLNYLAELGVVGLSLLVALIVNLSAMAFAIWKDHRRFLVARRFGLITLVLVVCHVTNGMFHDVSIAPMSNMFLYFIAGVTTNLYTTALSMETAPEGRSRQKIGSDTPLDSQPTLGGNYAG